MTAHTATAAASLAPRLATPLHTAFQGAQALWWPHAQNRTANTPPKPPRVFLLFIPGNPGLSSYYVPYLDTIYNSPELRGQVEILAVSHRGHAPLPLSGASFPGGAGKSSSLWQALSGLGSSGASSTSTSTSQEDRTDLQAQIDHKIAAVKLIRSIYPNSRQADGGEESNDVKLVLLGHSVGAYIGLRTLQDRGEDIDGLQILFPTVMHIAKAPKAESLPLLLVTNPLVHRLVLPIPLLVLSLIPSIFLFALLRFATGMPAGGLHTTLDLLTTPGAALCAAQMARDEFLTIKSMSPEMLAAVRALRERGGTIRSYWSRGDEDPWAPSGHREALEGALCMARVPLPPHLWGVSPEEMADLTHSRSASRSRSLRSRTLQIGGTITRAAGRKIVSSSRLASRAALGAAGVGGESRQEGVDSPRHSKFLFQDQEKTSSSALSSGPASPTNPRFPHRKGTYRRRPSLSLAKAKRSLDGSITLELPQGEDWGFLEEQAQGQEQGQIQEEDEGEQSSEGEDARKHARESDSVHASPSAGLRARKHGAILHASPLEEKDEDAARPVPAGGTGTGTGAEGNNGGGVKEGTLTSTVCNIGMPHAFCLRHGEKMGGISAHWIAEDHF